MFKKWDKTDPANHRPISLTFIRCKIREHIIYSQTMKHLNKKHTHWPTTGLKIEDPGKRIDLSKQTDAILLDINEAFDKVPHQRLLMKTDHYDIRGQVKKWAHPTCYQWLSLIWSTHVNSQVPQGSVLAPFPFYYRSTTYQRVSNQISDFVADDCFIERSIKKLNRTDILQMNLNKLERWEKENVLQPSKREVLRVTIKKTMTKTTDRINEETFRKWTRANI